MCLQMGTPERLRLSRLGAELPPLEDTREALIATLRAELLSGCYFDPHHYHPLLAVLLMGLATRDQRLPEIYRDPYHKLCETVQSAAIVFGIGNSETDYFPDPVEQGMCLLFRLESVYEVNYAVARLTLKCCAPAALPLFADEMADMRRAGGFGGLLFEVGAERGLLVRGGGSSPECHC